MFCVAGPVRASTGRGQGRGRALRRAAALRARRAGAAQPRRAAARALTLPDRTTRAVVRVAALVPEKG